jgi:DNA-binding IclR family transcriptional regulator
MQLRSLLALLMQLANGFSKQVKVIFRRLMDPRTSLRELLKQLTRLGRLGQLMRSLSLTTVRLALQLFRWPLARMRGPFKLQPLLKKMPATLKSKTGEMA